MFHSFYSSVSILVCGENELAGTVTDNLIWKFVILSSELGIYSRIKFSKSMQLPFKTVSSADRSPKQDLFTDFEDEKNKRLRPHSRKDAIKHTSVCGALLPLSLMAHASQQTKRIPWMTVPAGKPSSSHDEIAKLVHSSTARSYGLSMVTESPLLSSKPKALQSAWIQPDVGGLFGCRFGGISSSTCTRPSAQQCRC